MSLKNKTVDQLKAKLKIIEQDLECAHLALKGLNPDSVLGYLGVTALVRKLEKERRKILDLIIEKTPSQE